MIEIIAPDQFKTVPWKSGKGETIEMAINAGGTLANFDWRLSMASVVEDGIFSNFASYTRNLILIAGDGINLQHNDNKIDKLSNILEFATFDGGNKTVGNLHSNEITDFNIITNTTKYDTSVVTQTQMNNYLIKPADLCFIYSLYLPAQLSQTDDQVIMDIPAQHLVKITPPTDNMVKLSGDNLIVVYLNKHK
jgi:environmental stress-induced protein Ves